MPPITLPRSSVPPPPLPAEYPVTPLKVTEAYERISAHVHRTPVLTCSTLDALAGRALHFKCEVLQRTGSFKIRGATNASLLAPPGAALVTHSSGNHAQAVAVAAKVRFVVWRWASSRLSVSWWSPPPPSPLSPSPPSGPPTPHRSPTPHT